MQDLKRLAVRGGLARLCGQAANFALRVVFIAVMARLLDPKDFGLVAMVTAVTGFYEIFTSAGLSAATIQHADINDKQVSTLFWINFLVGTALALLCLSTAPVLVRFYGEPRLFWVTVAMSGGFIVSALGVQHVALLNRELRFAALTTIETFSRTISIVAGVGLAVVGLGYWALVAATIVFPTINTICVWGVTGWIPGRPHRGIGIRSMLSFGGTITLNMVVVHIAYNLEKVLVGRYWGADVLGLYGRAYQLINIPTENLHSAVGGVAFSALSRVQQDPIRLRSYFLKGYSLVNSLTIPLTVFCALFASDIILVFLGPKWTEAASIFRLMTPTVLVFGAINPTSWLLWSTGRQGRSLAIALVIAPLVISAYVIGLPYGPNGVAFAYSAAMMLWLFPHIVWSLNGTSISPRHLFSAVSRPVLSAVIAGLFALASRVYLDQLASPLLRLVLGGGLMVASYCGTLLFVLGQRTFYVDLFGGLKGLPEKVSN